MFKYFNKPGGSEIILKKSGQDVSEEFKNIGHSPEAFQMLNKY